MKPVRFNETIHGRPYVIEVSAVGAHRWRAQLARRGTALMPFYGTTPEEAAQQLTVWLTRAGRDTATIPPHPMPTAAAPTATPAPAPARTLSALLRG